MDLATWSDTGLLKWAIENSNQISVKQFKELSSLYYRKTLNTISQLRFLVTISKLKKELQFAIVSTQTP